MAAQLNTLLTGYATMDARELIEGVSYAKFQSLAWRMEWTAEYLANALRGHFEVRGETFESYFDRILHCRPTPEVTIPFRSVIEKFLATVQYLVEQQDVTLCLCGCGSFAGGGSRLAWDTCKRPDPIAKPLSEAKLAALEKARRERHAKGSLQRDGVGQRLSENPEKNLSIDGPDSAGN